MRQISDRGIQAIQKFEGERLAVYGDTRGIPTIGYGHTGPEVRFGMANITPEQAGLWLQEDLETTEHVVDACLPASATQNQFDACVSLAFNIGIGNFKNSTVLRDICAGNILGAAAAFLLWSHNHDGSTNPGLLARRKAERTMFLGMAA